MRILLSPLFSVLVFFSLDVRARNHPELMLAMVTQIDRQIFCSRIFVPSEPQPPFAEPDKSILKHPTTPDHEAQREQWYRYVEHAKAYRDGQSSLVAARKETIDYYRQTIREPLHAYDLSQRPIVDLLDQRVIEGMHAAMSIDELCGWREFAVQVVRLLEHELRTDPAPVPASPTDIQQRIQALGRSKVWEALLDRPIASIVPNLTDPAFKAQLVTEAQTNPQLQAIVMDAGIQLPWNPLLENYSMPTPPPPAPLIPKTPTTDNAAEWAERARALKDYEEWMGQALYFNDSARAINHYRAPLYRLGVEVFRDLSVKRAYGRRSFLAWLAFHHADKFVDQSILQELRAQMPGDARETDFTAITLSIFHLPKMTGIPDDTPIPLVKVEIPVDLIAKPPSRSKRDGTTGNVNVVSSGSDYY